ncbi:stalk domain-containing protein [Schinkia sp. CFF1]
MKMKKILNIVTIAAIVSGPLLIQSPASAQSMTKIVTPIAAAEESNQQVDVSNFMKVSGVISKINMDGELPKLIVENTEKTTETHFPIPDQVMIFNSATTEQLTKDSLTEGLQIDVYYDKSKPMLMIYPPIITPEIVIVNDETKMGFVKVALFDENLVSLDHQLKLNVADDTILLNDKGEKINVDDLKGKELIVFYSVTTKSIPAQTTPSKIIALDIAKKHLLEEVNHLIQNDYFMKNETKMIPLRQVAGHLGYEVKWKNGNTAILVQKQNRSFTISIGKEEYGYNKSLRYFKAAPVMKDGKTYVSEEFLDLLNTNE